MARRLSQTLREQALAQQAKTYTRWMNTHLCKRNMEVKDIFTDLCDGVRLINLFEVMTSHTFPRYHKEPKNKIHRLENINMAVQFAREAKVLHTDVGAAEIESGNKTAIIGMAWQLILRYQMGRGLEGQAEEGKHGGGGRPGDGPPQAGPKAGDRVLVRTESGAYLPGALLQAVGEEGWMVNLDNGSEVFAPTQDILFVGQHVLLKQDDNTLVPAVISKLHPDDSVQLYLPHTQTSVKVSPSGKVHPDNGGGADKLYFHDTVVAEVKVASQGEGGPFHVGGVVQLCSARGAEGGGAARYVLLANHGEAPRVQQASVVIDPNNAKRELMAWVNQQLKPWGIQISNFRDDWKNPLVMCALVNSVCPGSVDVKKLAKEDMVRACVMLAMKRAEDAMGVPRLLDPEDVLLTPDQNSILTYVSYFPLLATLESQGGGAKFLLVGSDHKTAKAKVQVMSDEQLAKRLQRDLRVEQDDVVAESLVQQETDLAMAKRLQNYDSRPMRAAQAASQVESDAALAMKVARYDSKAAQVESDAALAMKVARYG